VIFDLASTGELLMALSDLKTLDEMNRTPRAQPKSAPSVYLKRAKAKAEDREWRLTCKRVDDRDKLRCFVTGKPLMGGHVDAWQALERHHLEPRSRNKSRRFNHKNVVTTARAIHQLIHAGALRLLDKRGAPAKAFNDIDSVQWNRLLIPKGDEPCRIRKGLPISEATTA
jgi:hypothetical protein